MTEINQPLFIQARLCGNTGEITGKIERFNWNHLICAVSGNKGDSPQTKTVAFSDCDWLVVYRNVTVAYTAHNGRKASVSGHMRADYSGEKTIAIKDGAEGSRTIFVIPKTSIHKITFS